MQILPTLEPFSGWQCLIYKITKEGQAMKTVIGIILVIMIVLPLCGMAFGSEKNNNESRRFNEAITPRMTHPGNSNGWNTTTNDRVKNSPRYTVPHFSGKGTYGQAK